MTLSRFWMYHLMAVAAVTVVFSAYKRKKYQDIYEASAILELKKELEEMYPHHYTKPTLVHTVMTGTCTVIANQAVQTAYSFDERISDTPPRLFLFYYLHVWILLVRDSPTQFFPRNTRGSGPELVGDVVSEYRTDMMVSVSLMKAVDIFFVFRQRSLFIFKHWMPESFTCSEFPCNHGRDTPTTCYVNRSTEKSIIINLHLLVVILGKTFNRRRNFQIGPMKI